MKHLRLSLLVLALALAGTWANQATACDKDKSTAASATAAHASCSAEMAAACKASKSTKTSAATAASSAGSMDCCASKSAKTAVASTNAKTTKGTTVAASDGGCMGMMDAALVSTAGHGSCASGAKTTAAAGSGGQCSAKSSTSAARSAHGECDACADMLLCNGELETAGTRIQIVPLKNGVMFVYTAEEPGGVSAVQSAMARRSQRLSQIVTAGDRAQLCADCKMMRGAIASGKMTREVINIEGGALTLMTSTDPAMVKKIRSMVDANKVARAKS